VRVGRIYAIAINTFREAVRDRVLHGVLGFGCAVLFFTLALAQLALTEEARVIQDVGLASISLFSVLVAIFLGSSLLYKEIERKTLYVILPKPIRRTEFLIGKYLGICITAFVFVTLMGALQLWVSVVKSDAEITTWAVGTLVAVLSCLGLAVWRARDRTAVVIPWSLVALAASSLLVSKTEVELQPVLAQLVLVSGEVMILAAVALLFSSFSTPFLTGVLTLGVWLLGRSADDMATLKAKQVGESLVQVLRVLAEIVPNLNLFVPGRTILHNAGDTDVWVYVGQSLGYGSLYAGALLFLASRIFQRRDFI
jgi:ABC-type transport system involved in multi-copper enzyme maturation permease subunit